MLSRREAQSALTALETLDSAFCTASLRLRAAPIETFNALMMIDTGEPATHTIDERNTMIDEAQQATRVRFDAVYDALNRQLSDNSVV